MKFDSLYAVFTQIIGTPELFVLTAGYADTGTGTVTQLVECPHCDWEVLGSILGRHTKDLKSGTSCFCFAPSIKKVELGVRIM